MVTPIVILSGKSAKASDIIRANNLNNPVRVNWWGDKQVSY